MKITSKGQVTIPQEVREEAGLLPHTEVRFVVEGGNVRIIKVETASGSTRGALAVERLRRARGHTSLTTDEIMAMTRSEE